MPNILVYDPTSPGVANRVVKYRQSVPEPEFDVIADGNPYLVQPVLPVGFTVQNSKVVDDEVELLTQDDVDAIDTANTKASLDGRRISHFSDKTPTAVLNRLGMNVKINEQ